ncbi:cell division protein ZipA [Vibrio ponticus]|uniref:Cell division protein ZipA n=1 Tax=Vibrio ponticus TaxID=265668 RepID=A0A3N3DVJ9_9VIBR|nr:cell division protein ZipA [Vibrio ponticus]ROV58525.1 cell division protein ZipA [Vibrio ponticus]
MQELRFVLIVVGALAIAALLFHGLWTSKKEGKSKFSDKPLGKLDVDSDEISDRSAERGFAPEDDFEIIRKDRKEPELASEIETNAFAGDPLLTDPLVADPLTGDYPDQELKKEPPEEVKVIVDEVPSMSALDERDIEVEPVAQAVVEDVHSELTAAKVVDEVEESQPEPEPELEVIVLNVHCAGEEPFIGTKLFDSMQRHGLSYGEMDIFHCRTEETEAGRVLFSVANMMQPGTLKHHDPAEFTTKGISFFMTLPCYGDEEQNFRLMLRTAQQIADDMSGRVLDDARNLLTPTRIDSYQAQIKQFKARQAS